MNKHFVHKDKTT